MNVSPQHVQSLLDWLVRTTWQAGILVCLILLAQNVLGHRLGVRARHGLWFLLLVRLVLPWAPPSECSVYNLLPVPFSQGQDVCARHGNRSLPGTARTEALTESAGAFLQTPCGNAGTGFYEEPARFLKTAVPALLLLVWLIGAAALLGRTIIGHVWWRRLLRRARPITDRWVLEILDECRHLMGTRTPMTVVATDQVPCPTLCGLWRPQLLVPREILVAGDRDELRHIFLHELAHLQRRDIPVGYVASLLHILHWFNPLVALGLRRMRADRELVCDSLALSRLHPNERSAYGHTVVRQIERLCATQWHSVPAGLCGERTRIKQRIAMISQAGPRVPCRSCWAVVLIGVLACVGLTDGLVADQAQTDARGLIPPISNADRHGNAIRVHLRHRDTGRHLAVDGDEVVCRLGEPGEAGLWEARFDDDLGNPDHRVYLYSVVAQAYLTSDEQGGLAVSQSEPEATGRWIVWARPQGTWLISDAFPSGYLRLDEQGHVDVVNYGRDERSYWDVEQIWRVKVSDNPASNSPWRRRHVPGPD